MSSVKKSRATLIGVALAFIIPIIGAKLVLDQHWYQGAATNQGIMLVPPVELGELKQGLPEGWVVLLPQTGACGLACQQGLYAINQLDVALGKESGRVSPVFLTPTPTEHDLSQTPVVKAVADAELSQPFASLPADQIFIIDPLGNVILHYPLHQDEEAMRMEAKSVLSDLRKLLKLSRVG
ncbi:hypothetical protein [Pseudidiomarina taiwanensis]|uniref:Cytochrome oxidase n=1 Tax=Pseudidiomarina taiwanensis TaxID=337250 RepID=A0A432ZL02_9GAMM|nr:hypothetical protein [Pseudidiomarina taiwanensis]RUO78661.1 hypothetical protein CWI83_06480 [Pseudidiomarina taiwanensis]